MKLGMLGCGTIGGTIADAIQQSELTGIHVVAIASLPPRPIHADTLGAYWSSDPRELMREDIDVVFEAATQDTVREYAIDLIQSGKHLILMSVGALVDTEFRTRLIRSAATHQREIVIPSGAIGGLDLLRAARQSGGLSEVSLTTAKHPRGLVGAPYLERHQIDVMGLSSRQTVFEGTATEAVPAFPKNVNVAAAVSLAGLGFDQTHVKVIADPELTLTTHTLEAVGKFGKLYLQVQAVPHPHNPKTSYIACLAALATVANFKSPLKVGY